jgi:hypothetical protein
MKKIILLTVLMMFAALVHIFACDIVVGQSYEYEWTIINFATGAVIDSGRGTAIPATDRGFRNIEHYIRSAVLGWNSRTRTVSGVRQRLILTIGDCEHGG